MNTKPISKYVQFMNISEEDGWDASVKWYEKQYGRDYYVKLYWDAYKYMDEYDDEDNGVCFMMREYAIEKIAELIKEGITVLK